MSTRLEVEAWLDSLPRRHDGVGFDYGYGVVDYLGYSLHALGLDEPMNVLTYWAELQYRLEETVWTELQTELERRTHD